jgi:hypothetical protein
MFHCLCSADIGIFIVNSRMRRQTRKNRKQGGATNHLPVPEKYEDFNWKMYYMSGHGNILDTMLFVPENTYVLHLATAGNGCGVFKKDIEELIYENNDNTKRHHIWKSLKDGTFLKNSKNIYHTEKIYDPGNISYDQTNFTNSTISFYEPGDIISNISIQLNNNKVPAFLLGLYELPISHEIQKRLFNINKCILKNGANMCSLTTSNINHHKVNMYHYNDKIVSDIPENLLQHDIFHNNIKQVELDYIFNRLLLLSLISSNYSPRLLIISTCRIPINPSTTKSRRLSISTRKRYIHNNIQRTRLTKYFLNSILDKLSEIYLREPSSELFNIRSVLQFILFAKKFDYNALLWAIKESNKYIQIQPELLNLLNI